MTSLQRSRRAARADRYAPLIPLIRLELCGVREPSTVRAQHVASLLAWHPDVQRIGTQVVWRFAHGPTACWLAQALNHRGAELAEIRGPGGQVCVTNPQTVLGPYGYRDGRWMFEQGFAAGLGISRGAVHAAGAFGRFGLRVACPNTAMMLTLTAVLARLGVKAVPSSGEPCAVVAAGDVPDALIRLGAGGVADPYRRIRDTRGKDARS